MKVKIGNLEFDVGDNDTLAQAINAQSQELDALKTGELKVGDQDVLVGELVGCPFYMGKAQFELWQHTDLTIDVVDGRGASFSLEIPEGKRFIVRSEVCAVD